MIVDDFELSDVLVFLHDAEEFDENFGDGPEKDLFFAFAFCVDDGLEGICQDIDLHHLWTAKN